MIIIVLKFSSPLRTLLVMYLFKSMFCFVLFCFFHTLPITVFGINILLTHPPFSQVILSPLYKNTDWISSTVYIQLPMPTFWAICRLLGQVFMKSASKNVVLPIPWPLRALFQRCFSFPEFRHTWPFFHPGYYWLLQPLRKPNCKHPIFCPQTPDILTVFVQYIYPFEKSCLPLPSHKVPSCLKIKTPWFMKINRIFCSFTSWILPEKIQIWLSPTLSISPLTHITTEKYPQLCQ